MAAVASAPWSQAGLGGETSHPSAGGCVMPVDRFHRQVAGIVLRAASQFGFALAGGNALISHGFVDRLTQDVDVFTDQEGGVEAASGIVEEALVAAGLQAVPVDKTGG